MITIDELLKGKDFDSLDASIKFNLNILLERLNKLRTLWGKPLQITSGLRTKEDQIRVYKEKGITDINKIPMGSRHITGQAADIYDPKFELTNFCKANVNSVLKECELWAEDDITVPRLHVQCTIPKSGSRWFLP